jgi:hypothetical protein
MTTTCKIGWPALFRNKPFAMVGAVSQLATDRSSDGYIRVQAIEVVLALGQSNGSEALEQALAWLAKLIEDKTEDDQLRLSAADTLLDFPRTQYRTLLEIMSLGLNGDIHFGLDEVAAAFELMEDTPQWVNFADPWSFYSAEKSRQREELWRLEDDIDDLDLANEFPLFANQEYGYDLRYLCALNPQNRPQRSVPLRQRQEV